jgi:hypothetical protein
MQRLDTTQALIHVLHCTLESRWVLKPNLKTDVCIRLLIRAKETAPEIADRAGDGQTAAVPPRLSCETVCHDQARARHTVPELQKHVIRTCKAHDKGSA